MPRTSERWPASLQTPFRSFGECLVGADGSVLRPNGKRVVAQPRNGYLRVKLVVESKKRWIPLHTLVLTAFVGPRPSPAYHGAHRDGDRRRNAITNLAWKLPHENEADKRAHGTAPRGGWQRPLRTARRRAILRALQREGATFTKVAARYSVHRKTVARIAAC